MQDQRPAQAVELEPHPLAKIFPPIEGAARADLKADIEANGVIEDIVLHPDGRILDGLNRYAIAREVGAIFGTRTYTGDNPVQFVLSANLHRRHLDPSQRAMIADSLANMPQGRPGKTATLQVKRADAAALLNVSERSIANAAIVREHGAAELVTAVERGHIPVSTAAELASKPQEEQREIVARGEREILEAAKAIRADKVERKRAEKIAITDRIRERNADLPAADRKFSAIYVDPPWSFSVWSGQGKDRSAENHYPTMTQAEIEALPVANLAADNCALFMWAVMPQLPEALRAIEAWGFEFTTCAFVWVKQTKDAERFATGMGYWTRANAEVCLLATKGAPARLNANVHQVVLAPRTEHSRKPDEVADRIMRLVPGPYIELFARSARPGWDRWGNEAPPDAADQN